MAATTMSLPSVACAPSCRNKRVHADRGSMYVGLENSPAHGLLLTLRARSPSC
jgi:hypothetical protein